MRWSKLKSLVEARFSPALGSRVAINSTIYSDNSSGHAWLTVDKQVVANFCTRAFWNRARGDFSRENNRWVTDCPVPATVTEAQNNRHGEMDYGELSRESAYQSCWEFVHDLSVEDALKSKDPLIQALTMLDSRVGKRRLRNLKLNELHPLAKKMLAMRLSAEGIHVDT